MIDPAGIQATHQGIMEFSAMFTFQLRGKHCRHPFAVMGVIDTFRPGHLLNCRYRDLSFGLSRFRGGFWVQVERRSIGFKWDFLYLRLYFKCLSSPTQGCHHEFQTGETSILLPTNILLFGGVTEGRTGEQLPPPPPFGRIECVAGSGGGELLHYYLTPCC